MKGVFSLKQPAEKAASDYSFFSEKWEYAKSEGVGR
jgi:hypothetical protein